MCQLDTTYLQDAKHYGKTGETPATMYYNTETRQIALFHKTSGDLITADKFRPKYFNNCVKSGKIGKLQN